MQEFEERTSGGPPLAVQVDYVPFVNFAMQQNSVPLLRTVSIENGSENQLDNLLVRIWSEPPVFAEKTAHIDSIASGAIYSITEASLTLLRKPLRNQVEREEGHLWVEVTADGVSVYKEPRPLSVLAYNEWYGVSSLLEIVAAHVLPNDPAIDRILTEASRILMEQTQDGSLSGYQSGNPQRAYAEAAAIYSAASRQGIRYTSPPASFEETGQKIRTPERLIARKLGTCMDTSALLAACFEQAGLNPVIVMVEEHAFPGVWLVDKAFDDPVTKHESILSNRASLGEFLVIESTGITKSPTPEFTTALDVAWRHIQNEGHFHYSVDIAAARKIGIRPLSLVEEPGGLGESDVGPDTDSPSTSENLTVPEAVVAASAATSTRELRKDESPADRLARWKTSLLDLTYRNRQLAFKDTKKSIPLLCPDIAKLEDALAADEAFVVRQKPDTWSENDPRDTALHREQTGKDGLDEYLREEMTQRRLHTAVTGRELAVRLTSVERAARLGMEEGGANTLFLALGFLVYTEAETSDIERRAPILLVPMSIERKSVRDGFRIRRIDEESRINVTLLEKLKVDFGITIDGLDPLPEDDSGLDVPKILRAIRDAIKRQPRWKVVEKASLTILTFSRFLMWLDLEANADTLKENTIVRHLVETSNEHFDPGATFPDLATLDEAYTPSNTFCPLYADSSQLRAIFAAAEGRTFVLQGPPGTGKSQTITNLISHCLTLGKRVLFVAQKRAALDVVHKRLTNIGLSPFCLELHSNKTTKQSFRTQMRAAINVAGTRSDESWATKTNRLTELRAGLNTYVRDLHQPRAFGKSAYWIISQLISRNGDSNVALDLGDPTGRTGEEFERMHTAVRELAEAARVSGAPVIHPLRAVRLAHWNYGDEDDARKIVQATEVAFKELRNSALSVFPDLGLDASRASLKDMRTASKLTALLKRAPHVTQTILKESDWPQTKSELANWVARGRGCAKRRSALLATYTEPLFSLDLPELIASLRARSDTWFYRKWRLGMSVRKAIRTVRKDGNNPKDLTELEQDLITASAIIDEEAKLISKENAPFRLFGPLWKGLNSKWDDLQQVIEWVDVFRPILDHAPGADLDSKLKTRNAWIRLATEGRSAFVAGSPAAQQAREFRDMLNKAKEQRVHLDNLLQLDKQMAWGSESDDGMLEQVGSTLTALSMNLPQLREWSHYQSARAHTVKLGLGGLANALDHGEVGIQNLESTFKTSFADWWARVVLKSVPSLAGFFGEQHSLKIKEFREHDAEIAELTKKEIFARIASALPRTAASGKRTPASSEVGILQRFAKGGRKTIRRMFKECPNALARYKPCVLMSPLSVAQFIGADFPKFDMVVFDEASQMPTYDAIGAVARGNQLIVVGDSRQLPPTTFFQRQTGDEEFDEDDLPEELESILEEAEASGIRPLHLDWHYRSRHESLITFSNRRYYENRLHTFPAALSEHPTLGVHWREIQDGVYDWGKSRTNIKEAEAVVAEIVRRLRDPMEQNNSLGVVTFSVAQQRLIEDLLDDPRRKHPEIEPYFTTVDEPVFIKNLETVQGDERDVILFSICYGPDAAGITRMNFGPLNNKGGERRLNVAITRARKQMLVFSSIRPEQIDCSRTAAVGVHDLRTFLDYAKRGPVALIEEVTATTGEIESPFEQSVYDELTKRGWRVDCQVGCSGYRIDLAIRHPDTPGSYLLGIECDGANYHSAKSARDRDQIRQAVLEGLGWQLHRVWSTDWWHQRPKEIAKLDEAIERAKIKMNAAERVDLNPSSNIPTTQSPDVRPAPSGPDTDNLRIKQPVVRPESDVLGPAQAALELPGQITYQRFELGTRAFSGELHDSANARHVRDLVMKVTHVEAPLLFDTLCSEIASFWGLQRAGRRIRDVIKQAVKRSDLVVRKAGKRKFVWTKELAARPYEGFRVSDTDDPKPRQMQEICPEEVSNAAAAVLAQHISMNTDDLARETAGVFGIRRLGTNVHATIGEGIVLMKEQGRCRVDGSNLIAP